ncbi:hypothetical protein HRbin01_01280 [archaeon HR01]|nr:hypothetical protein HRbin01_01280 [archaeon HR01]
MVENWRYTGEWITSCNCDWGCPCNFNSMPTEGNCEGVVALKIRDGNYGKTSLADVCVACATWWPGAIHQGNGILQIYIDDKVSVEQEKAMVEILSGRAGGKPWPIFAKTFASILPPKRAPIEMEVKGKDTKLKVGSYVDIAAEPMRNPVTNEEAYADITLHQYLIFNKGSLFSNKRHIVKESTHPRLQFSHPGKYLAVAEVRHQGP